MSLPIAAQIKILEQGFQIWHNLAAAAIQLVEHDPGWLLEVEHTLPEPDRHALEAPRVDLNIVVLDACLERGRSHPGAPGTAIVAVPIVELLAGKPVKAVVGRPHALEILTRTEPGFAKPGAARRALLATHPIKHVGYLAATSLGAP